MTNPFRGEVSLVVNGRPCTMRLSLGALAELEASLGTAGLLPLIERFENSAFTAADLIALLFAGLKGGGWEGSREDLDSAEIDGGIVQAAKAAGEMLALAFALPE